MRKLIDPNEVEHYDRDSLAPQRHHAPENDWAGAAMIIIIGIVLAWLLIDKVIGADTIISWFE